MNNKHTIIWGELSWINIQNKVRKIQCNIYNAKLRNDSKLVHAYQKLLVSRMEAKLLSVRQVTVLNKGKSTPGIDKLVITTPEDRLKLAMSLSLDGKSLPIRRVWIPKPGKKELRPLGIPVIEDRAKQALAKLALEPEWEAVFEANSYGFRPGRSCHDAVEAIFLSLRHDTPKWVYDADIRKCFDRINHDFLLEKLNTFPLMRNQVCAWLKSGVMEGYANSPKSHLEYTSEGTPQGGVISPLLANIALHGLENHLKTYVGNLPLKPHPGANRGKASKEKALTIVRYADDFVLIHRNREILDLCIKETRTWLAKAGLEINEDKSKVVDARNSFLFLGFQFIMVRKSKTKRYKVKITPSRASQTRFTKRIRDIVQRNKAISSYNLILMLRPVIIGWGNYFKYCECSEIFGKLTHKIFQKLRAWVLRRDNRNGRLFLKEKYFPSGKTFNFYGKKHSDNWILHGYQKKKGGHTVTNYLPHLSWIPSQKHVKVLGTESPYSLSHYWALRNQKYSPYPLRVRTLLVKQNNRCTLCKKEFNVFDSNNWQVDHIQPRWAGGKDTYDNLQLLHKECHENKTLTDTQKYTPKRTKHK